LLACANGLSNNWMNYCFSDEMLVVSWWFWLWLSMVELLR
jgi:hypothetical protein